MTINLILHVAEIMPTERLLRMGSIASVFESSSIKIFKSALRPKPSGGERVPYWLVLGMFLP
jgi:hypothetical protein